MSSRPRVADGSRQAIDGDGHPAWRAAEQPDAPRQVLDLLRHAAADLAFAEAAQVKEQSTSTASDLAAAEDALLTMARQIARESIIRGYAERQLALEGTGVRNRIPAGRRIMVGVDGSAASVAALGWAAGEARLRQAELRLVCVWEDAEHSRAPYAAHGGLPSRGENRAAAAGVLAASVRAVFGQDPPPGLRTELVEGRPERVLLDRAADAELLVLGRSCRAGDFLQPAGPVHRACLRGAPCPVVMVGMCHETGNRLAGPLPASLRKAS